MMWMHTPPRTAGILHRASRLWLAAVLGLALWLPGAVQAVMLGYITNANGIYLANSGTGVATLLYNGAPFDGSTTVAGAAMRPSDGMLFFTYGTSTNQPVYRWNPATPATAPVLLGNTGAGAYIHRVAFHPTNGNLYGADVTPATTLWTISQTTGATTAAAAISGLPVNTSGDIAFNPLTGNLYAPIQTSGTGDATIYQIPLGGGAVTNVGTITGLPTGGVLNSAMFNAAGTLFVGGGSTNLYSAPLSGGGVTLIGNFGITPQDFGNAPAPSPTVTKAFGPTTVIAGSSSVLTLTLSNPYANPQNGAAIVDTYPAGMVNAATPAASSTCGGTVSATPGGNTLTLSGGSIPANGSCTVSVNVTSAAAGSYNNTIAAGDFSTVFAINDVAANATLTVTTLTLSGRVFEDVNYGGGAGRSQAASSGVAVANARVELYNAGGAFVASTTTNGSGDYSFPELIAGNYTVRVVNNTVASTRAGACPAGTCLPVQTWRTDATSGTAIAVDDRVGGENPQLLDAGIGSTTLAALTTATTTAQSITAVTLGASSITGLDFGYNFDTIVNTANTGQGSFRQFIVNANALGGDGSLAQAGFRTDLVTGGTVALANGVENSIFMISDGAAHAGLRAGLSNQLSSGRALIGITSLLPTISTAMNIEGGTQTYNVGNTNNVTLGAGGTVGVAATALPQLNGPEVELRDGPAGSTGLATGLRLGASNVTIRGLSIVGFGNTVDHNANANIRIDNFSGTLINQNVIGTTALSFADPAGVLRGTGDIIRITAGADNGTISQNLIGFTAGNGIGQAGTSNGWAIERNEIRGNAIGNPARDGIEWNSSSTTNTIRFNLFALNTAGAAFHAESNNADALLITQNTFANNGGATNEGAIVFSSGDNATISLNIVRDNIGPGIKFLNGSTGNTVLQNVIQGNSQSGIQVDSGAATNTLSQNAIFGNTRIGIDLLTTAQGAIPAPPYYTQNDNGDGDGGGNAVLNFPQITGATVSGGNLILTGIAPAGATIELFISDNDATGFGEGQTYLVTLTEGSAGDTAGGTSANTVTCGSGAVAVTMNNFTFTIPVPGGVTGGTSLTATSTVASNTSEFSCNATTVMPLPSLTFLKTVAVTSDPINGGSNPKFIPGAEALYTLNVTNSGTGGVDTNTLTVIDPIPANTELFTGNLSGGAPFVFVDGAPASGLSCAFAALNNFADCVDFSNNGGATWSYVPNGGFDSAVTHIRFIPAGAMNADAVAGSPSPNFSLQFRVRVQ